MTIEAHLLRLLESHCLTNIRRVLSRYAGSRSCIRISGVQQLQFAVGDSFSVRFEPKLQARILSLRYQGIHSSGALLWSRAASQNNTRQQDCQCFRHKAPLNANPTREAFAWQYSSQHRLSSWPQ
jgi:hypothetical protein